MSPSGLNIYSSNQQHIQTMYTSPTPHKQADRTGMDTISYVGVHICTEIRQCLPRVLDTAACSPWLRHTHSGSKSFKYPRDDSYAV